MCRGFGCLRQRLRQPKSLMADQLPLDQTDSLLLVRLSGCYLRWKGRACTSGECRAAASVPHRHIMGHIHPVLDSSESIYAFCLVSRDHTSESHKFTACTSARYVTLDRAEGQERIYLGQQCLYCYCLSPRDRCKVGGSSGCLIETTWATNAALAE